MKKFQACVLVLVALLMNACVGTPSSQSSGGGGVQDLSGSWTLTTNSQVGAEDARMTVKQTGSALAGTIVSNAGSFDYTGSVKGSTIEFDVVVDVQGKDMKIAYSGTVQGDTMEGKAVFGQFGEGTFTAKRN